MILTRIQEAAARFPDKKAIQIKTGERYRAYTYREIISAVGSVSDALKNRGIVKGDRIVLLSENRPEWVIAYLAVVAMGAVIVPLDAQITAREVALLIGNSGAKAVFVSASTTAKVAQTGISVISFDDERGISFSEMLGNQSLAPPPQPSASELAAILYTSGTTGDPKGVMLSHGNLAANCASCAKLDLVHDDDMMLCLLPLHHTYPAMTCMLLPLSVGATITMLNSLKGPDILASMAETNVSILLGVPQLFSGLRRAIFDEIRKKPALLRAFVRALLKLNGFSKRTLRVNMGKLLFSKVHDRFGPHFRLFASGGARLEPDVYTDMSNLGFTIIEGYGLTETSPVSTFNPLSKQKAGSIGISLPDVEVRISNPDSEGRGEIAVRGPNVMIGYYNKPEETAEAIRDGWFYTGDLGYRDSEGYFFITGRSKEMIVLSSGKKIFPDELERFYKRIPEIGEICMIQAERGLEAAIVPDFEYLRKVNLPNSRESIAFAIEDISRELPPYKRISGFKIFKDPLPVTRLGKLRRSKVRELYMSQGERMERPVAVIDQELFNTPEAKKLVSCLEPFSAKKNIVPDDSLELDLGLDSLSRIEAVVSIEENFGISLPENFGSEVFTVRDVLVKLRMVLRARDSAPPLEAAERVRSSWKDILSREPSEEARKGIAISSGPVQTAFRYLLQSFVRIFFMSYGRLSVRGLENLPREGAFIIALNHVSLADAPAVAAAIPWSLVRRTYFLGTTAYFGGPVMSRVAKYIQVIPVDMEARLFNALQLSAHILRHQKVLCVFPEGLRARDGNLKNFKKGVGIIAGELNVPIIPAAIRGTFEMMPSGRKFIRPGKITITFGKPLFPEKRAYEEIVSDLREAVKLLLLDR